MLAGIVKKIPLSKGYATPVNLLALAGVNIIVTLFINYLLAEHVTPEQYGSWRLFLTITSFSGLFHFGLIDGVAIQWLFKDQTTWHKSVKRDFIYLVIQQTLIFSVGIILVNMPLFPQIHLTFIEKLLIINQIFLQNIAGLIQTFFNRTYKFYYNLLLTLFSQVIFCVGILAYKNGFTASINLLVLSNIQVAVAILPMLFLVSRETKGWPSIEKQDFRPANFFLIASESIGLGLPILLTGLLFLGFQSIDKLLISGYYPARQYGYYAFAAALLNVILTITASISNFLMQKLAPIRNSIELYYNKAVMGILCLICLILVSAIPLQVLINRFLPNYAESANYMRYLSGFIGPYLLVQLIQFNIFKLLEKQRLFLGLSIIIFIATSVLLLALAINQVALIYIALASALMAYVWFVASDWLLCLVKPECRSNQLRRYVFIVFTICLYLLVTCL